MAFTCQVVYLAVSVGYFKNRQEKSEPTGSSAVSTWCEHLLPTKAGIMGPRDRSGIMISFPYKFGSLLKSHLEHFFGASWPVPSAVSAPGATLSTSLCWGESILSVLYPLSRDTSAARRAQWWGDRSWQNCEIVIGLHQRTDFLSWWGMLRQCSSLLSTTLVAGNGTGVAAKLSLGF